MKKIVSVIFYSNAVGTEPVRDWLREELSKKDRHSVGVAVNMVETGWPIGMPTCRPLGNGLYEVRVNLKNRIARIFFCIHGGHMVLLHGIVKKTQRTPPEALKVALKRKREVEHG